MPIPNWFVNGPRRINPAGGEKLCELNPPFTQHATLEILVHCNLASTEVRHRTALNETRGVLICVNRDTIYLTVEPGDYLELFLVQLGAGDFVQGSLYAWR